MSLTSLKNKLDECDENSEKLMDILNELDGAVTSVEELVSSKLGAKVKKLKKHSNAQVAGKAVELMKLWATKFALVRKRPDESSGEIAKPDTAAARAGAAGKSDQRSSVSSTTGSSASPGVVAGGTGSSTPAKRKRVEGDEESGDDAIQSNKRPVSDEGGGDADSDDGMPTIPEGPQHDKRQKCWQLLYDALCLAIKTDQEANKPVSLVHITDDEPKSGPPALIPSDLLVRRICFDIEDCLFVKHGNELNRDYSTQLRSLMFNLKNPKNTALRQAVWSLQLSGHRLVRMTPNELADPDMKKQRAQMADYHTKAAMLEQPGDKRVTGMFKCGRCKKRETTYTQAQTRSADEPMTVFVTCLNCDNRWKW